MWKGPRKAHKFRCRKQEILDTVLKLFLRQGEDSVVVKMIAGVASIGEDTAYKHFEFKAEIYLRLILDYERDLAALFHSEDVARDKETLSRAYFELCMHDPQHYRLFDRLEERMVKTSQMSEMIEELHRVCASNFGCLTQLIKERIIDGKLEDVPSYFHYYVVWTLVYAVVALYYSPFWYEVLEDQEGFSHFLMDIDMCIGNKRKREGDAPSA